jgi:hypothetical protein
MSRRPHRARLALLAVALGLASVRDARAQSPRPYVPQVEQRSGLVYRMTPTPPRLPEDPDRDSFQGTRYESEKDNSPICPRNNWAHGGMYGHPLDPSCTAAVYPNFVGSPGSTYCADCQPKHPAINRWITNPLHPFKPVGMYYDRGVYTPIYDFDYPVPGPGPFPWSHFFKRPTGG